MLARGAPKALATMGTTMRDRKQFAMRLVVALGIAFVGMGAIDTVIAFSAVERARMIAEETVTQPFRPPVPNADYRLSNQQQLRRIFWVAMLMARGGPNDG
jgi:hypothetical protein